MTIQNQRTFCVVFGTRPEYIKLAPLVYQLRKEEAVQLYLIHTKQHQDLGMETGAFFGIKPDAQLHITPSHRTSLNSLYRQIRKELENQFRAIDGPFEVIVQGDTLSAFTAAETANYLKIPVHHVEAGLRTHHIKEPWPEELFRVMLSRLSTLHFAPTETAKAHLIQEGIASSHIFVTGNTVTDAFEYMKMSFPDLFEKRDSIRSNENRLDKVNETLPKENKFEDSKRFLLTLHRRENRKHEQTKVGEAIKQYLNHHPMSHLTVIQHPNPASHHLIHILENEANVTVLPPQSYSDFLKLMSGMDLILSDSGGLQEEAPLLGIPIVVLRNQTERPELISTEYGSLAGTDPKQIQIAIERHINSGRLAPTPLFGDGKASLRIEQILLNSE